MSLASPDSKGLKAKTAREELAHPEIPACVDLQDLADFPGYKGIPVKKETKVPLDDKERAGLEAIRESQASKEFLDLVEKEGLMGSLEACRVHLESQAQQVRQELQDQQAKLDQLDREVCVVKREIEALQAWTGDRLDTSESPTSTETTMSTKC